MDKLYPLLADAVLLSHAVFVLFVVLGLLLIVSGGLLGWRWIRKPWFRILHLLAIAIVVAQAWLGVLCPLTTLEMWLRRQSGAVGYEGSFIQYWVQRFLYYDAPAWVFVAVYTVFGLLVLLAMLKYPPRGGRGHQPGDRARAPRRPGSRSGPRPPRSGAG